ncbi:unnamed protein product [Mycena citricolor]|uniref:Uncharacterized protein n=1 Tax=Mycena citricolor TaxID=2018698 RepID=A0AAD2H5L6_9AGAR|nr:unnamed protein product [Mycena citricolor]
MKQIHVIGRPSRQEAAVIRRFILSPCLLEQFRRPSSNAPTHLSTENHYRSRGTLRMYCWCYYSGYHARTGRRWAGAFSRGCTADRSGKWCGCLSGLTAMRMSAWGSEHSLIAIRVLKHFGVQERRIRKVCSSMRCVACPRACEDRRLACSSRSLQLCDWGGKRRELSTKRRKWRTSGPQCSPYRP